MYRINKQWIDTCYSETHSKRTITNSISPLLSRYLLASSTIDHLGTLTSTISRARFTQAPSTMLFYPPLSTALLIFPIPIRSRVNYVLAPVENVKQSAKPRKTCIFEERREKERGGMSTIYVRGGDKTPCTSSSIMLSFSVRFLSRFSLGISRGEGENLSNSPWERRLKSRGAVRFLG